MHQGPSYYLVHPTMQVVEPPTLDLLLPANDNNNDGAGLAEEELIPDAAPATTTTTTSTGAPPPGKQSNGGPSPPPPRTSSTETGVAVAGPEAIGREIAIWSKSTGDWPKGTIIAFHKDTNLHTIKSPISGERTIDLSRVRWQWVKRPSLDSAPNPTFDKKYTGGAAIGCRVRCFWPGMGRWYTGKVQTYDGKTQQHTVKFRDGDIQHYVMKHEAMLFLDPPRPVVVNAPESKTPKKAINNINVNSGGKSKEGSKVVTTATKMRKEGKKKKSLNALSNNKKAAGKATVAKTLDGGVVKVKKSKKQTEKSLVKKAAKKNNKNAANNSQQVDNKSNKSSSGDDMVTRSPGTASPPKEQLLLKKGKKKAATTTAAKKRKKPLPPADASSDDDDEDIPLIQRGNVTICDNLSDEDDEVLSDKEEDDDDEMSFDEEEEEEEEEEEDEEEEEEDEEDDEEEDADDMDVDERALVAEPGDSDFEVESNRGRKPNKKKKKNKDKTIKNAAPRRLKITATGGVKKKQKTQNANINKLNNNSISMLNGNKRDFSSKKKAAKASRKDATTTTAAAGASAAPKRGSGGSRSIKGIRSPPRNQTVSEVGVGCRVSVYWAEDNTCYKGRLAQFDSYHKRHKLIYDDGEEEWVALSREKFAWLTPRAASSGCSVQARETVVNLTKSETIQNNNNNDNNNGSHHNHTNNNHNTSNGMFMANPSFVSSEFTWAPMNQQPTTTVVAGLVDEDIVDATTAAVGLDNDDDDDVDLILPPRDTNTNTAAASLCLENQDAINAPPPTAATKVVLTLPGGPFVGGIGGSLHQLPGHHGVGTKEPQGPGVATKDTPLGTADTFSSEGHQKLSEDQSIQAIGWLVSLYCPADKLWYRGEVVGFDRKRGKHNILYDDGEHDWCFLSQEKLIWHAQIVDNNNNNNNTESSKLKTTTKPAVAPRYPGVKTHHESPHSTAALGWRVGVYWPLELVFYTGEIIAWDGEEGQYEVAYDDGEEGTFYIATDKIKWLVAPEDSASPSRLRERRESDPARKRFGGGGGEGKGGGYGGRGGGFAGDGVYHGGDSDPDYDVIYERGRGTVGASGGGRGRGGGRGGRMMVGPHGYYYNGGFDGRYNQHHQAPSGNGGFAASPYPDLRLKTGRPQQLGGGKGSTSMLVASPTGAMLPPPPLFSNRHSSGGSMVYVPETYESEPVLNRKMTQMPAFAGCDMQLQTPLNISIYLNHSSEAANDATTTTTNDATKQQQKSRMLAGNSRRTPQQARLQARHSALKEMGRRVARAQQTIVKGIPTKMPSMQLYNQMYAASTRQYMNGQYAHQQQHVLVPSDGGNVHRLARLSGMVMSPFAGVGGSEEMHLNRRRCRPDESEDEEDEDDEWQQQQQQGVKKDADGDDFKMMLNSFSADKATAGNPSDDDDGAEQVIVSPKSPACPRGAKVKPGAMMFGVAGGSQQEEEELIVVVNNRGDNDNEDPLMVLNMMEERDIVDLTVGTAGGVIGADRDVVVIDEPLKEAAATAVVMVEPQTAPAPITTTMQSVEGRSNGEDANNEVGGVVFVEDKMPVV